MNDPLAEAAAALGPDICRRLDEFVATAPPLSDSQKKLIAALFAIALDQANTEAA